MPNAKTIFYEKLKESFRHMYADTHTTHPQWSDKLYVHIFRTNSEDETKCVPMSLHPPTSQNIYGVGLYNLMLCAVIMGGVVEEDENLNHLKPFSHEVRIVILLLLGPNIQIWMQRNAWAPTHMFLKICVSINAFLLN